MCCADQFEASTFPAPPHGHLTVVRGLGILKPCLNGVVNLDECNTGILT